MPHDKIFVCPVDVALCVFRGKWKPLIMWLLAKRGRRFSDFQNAIPQMSHKVLSQQLRGLEADGVIQRVMPSADSAHIEYRLTQLGRTLRPSLNALATWGKVHHDAIGAKLHVVGGGK